MKLYWVSPFLIQLFVRPTTRILMKLFCRTKVYGTEYLENLPSKLILASNHIHEFDPLILPSVLPFTKLRSPIFFVSLESKYYKHRGLRARLFYGGLLFKLMGAYPAYKGTGDYAQALQNHVRILNDGGTVYIFPEGKTSLDGKLGEARGGVAFLSESTNAPILPVFIDGIWNMGIIDFLLRRRRFVVKIGPLIQPQELFEGGVVRENMYKLGANRLLDIISKL